MATTTTTVSPLIPEEWLDELIVQPVTRQSVALDSSVTSTLTISGQVGHLPMITDDINAAWVNEGQEISPDDMSTTEVEVRTRKIAALTTITNEAVNDADRDVLALAGQSIARDIANRIDLAFFSEPVVASPAPSGLGGITPTALNAGAAFTSFDVFALAVSVGDQQGAPITSWVMNPADLVTWQLVKESSSSQRRLMASDPTQPSRSVIEGRPVLTSPAVKSGSIWGMPSSRAFVVRRQGVELARSTDVYFTSDRTALRATMRVGFAYPTPGSVIKITKSA